MIWLAGALLFLTLAMAVETLIGAHRLRRLAAIPLHDAASVPRLSIVVAARDEARGIEAAVRSMLEQRYEPLELVVVDDRSTDGTGEILDRLAASDPRLTVVHVDRLPDGWLGKNHALQLGADRARGDWVLFTDADIHMHPEALSRAVGMAETEGVDHLVVAPEMVLPGPLLQAFAVFFFYSFLTFAKPWRARDPKSWFFVGVGAFNLVRRSAYQAVGGHRPIALRPDDDMKLGKILKRGGFRQDALLGDGMLKVEWYHSLRELVRGLEKNMFSGLEYSPALSVAGGLVQLAVGVLPVVLLFLAGGGAQALFGAQVLATVGTMALLARLMRVRPGVALLYPVVGLLFVFILWRTMILNLVHGGIRWRGTFYSLDELKANRV